MFVGIMNVNAAGFTISRSTSVTSIGNTVSVTVNASGGAGWEYCVSYNQEVFKLTSANSDTGGACVKTGSTLTGYSSVTYKFQALKSGTGQFSVSGQMYNDSGESIATNGATTSITVKTKEEIQASLSGNNNLRVLEVTNYKIVPEFSKDVKEYTLDVPGDVESVQINAYLEDKTATVTPIDMVNLNEGANKFSITVTAANGSKKTYTITITRAEANPVKVVVDGKEYSVVNKEGALEVPAGFTASTVNVEGNDVVAYKNEKGNITLVVLKDAEGNMSYFMFKDGVFTPYNQITGSAITIVPVKVDKSGIADYEKSKSIKIGDKDVTVYYQEGNEDVVLIYGINTATGEEGWYYYNTEDGSLFKYMTNENVKGNTDVNGILKSKNDYKLLTMIFVGLSGLALLLIIILVMYIARLKRKNEELFDYMETRIKKHRDKKFNNIGDKDIEKSDLATFEDSEPVIEEEEVSEEDSEEVEEDTLSDKTILIREDEIIDLDEDNFDEAPKKKKDKDKDKNPTLISDTDILRNLAKANEESFQDEEPRKLSKKEEKLLKKKEKALAKQAQREFLDDVEYENSAFDIYERDETEVLPVVPKKKPRSKKKS